MSKIYDCFRFKLYLNYSNGFGSTVIDHVNGLKIFRTLISYKIDGSSSWKRFYLNKGCSYSISIYSVSIESVKRGIR